MKKWSRIIILTGVAGLFVALMIYSMTHKAPVSTEIWDEGTTIGDAETATRHYVQYTDIACPYCTIFTRLTIENEDAFHEFLAENHILYEIRMSEIIYDSTGSDMSRDSNVASYCALNEGKFIEYYHAAVMAIYEDYQSKGIGVSKTSSRITDMPDDYWVEIGHKIGLSDTFDECVNTKATLGKVIENTNRAGKYANGLPFFQFDKFTVSGFDPSWDYGYVERYLNAGL